jgi:hemolysin D
MATPSPASPVLAHRAGAFADLLRRYRDVLLHAWSQRAEMDCRRHSAAEAEFLPAALALQESPVSPAPRAAMALLIGFAALAVAWAVLGRIDIVAVGQGRVVPGGRTKTIQPLEYGIVRRIHVTEGQSVKAGDTLVELDATSAVADIDQLQANLSSLRLQSERGRALLESVRGGRAVAMKAVPGADAARMAEARRLYEGQLAEHHAKAANLDAEIAKRGAELVSNQALVHKLELTLPMARQRADDYKALLAEDIVSQHQWLEREQQRVEQEGDLANLRSRIREGEAALRATQAQRESLQAETARVGLDLVNEAQQKIAALEQDRIKAQSRARQLRLTAPVDGVVQQLAVHTLGGVVTPAQALMVVVPREPVVEVEAFLENKDIGFVNDGQRAEVKVEAFEYTRYGTVPARVLHVSNDAVQDEKKGLVYTMRVALDRADIQVEGKALPLSPGMAVTVEVRTGQRRVIEYFLSPLLQHASESLHER